MELDRFNEITALRAKAVHKGVRNEREMNAFLRDHDVSPAEIVKYWEKLDKMTAATISAMLTSPRKRV